MMIDEPGGYPDQLPRQARATITALADAKQEYRFIRLACTTLIIGLVAGGAAFNRSARAS
jgi:hypothetical protein